MITRPAQSFRHAAASGPGSSATSKASRPTGRSSGAGRASMRRTRRARGFSARSAPTTYELGEIDDKKGRFLVARFTQKGRGTADILAEAMPEVLARLGWPKSMRWGNGDARWVRPLQSIFCLFGWPGRAVLLCRYRCRARHPWPPLHGASPFRGCQFRRLSAENRWLLAWSCSTAPSAGSGSESSAQPHCPAAGKA